MDAPFDINSKESESIKFEDPFNGNLIEGYIYKVRSGKKYGMLYITRVNEKPAEQAIYCTPKLSYPYKGDGNLIYDSPNMMQWQDIDAEKLIAFEKIDGTNILCYIYKDSSGKKFVSYKTRLTPTLSENKFANFKALWMEILKKYPNLPDIILNNNVNVAFELYGTRNVVLVEYPDVLLDIKTLYGVNSETGDLILPTSLNMENIPIANVVRELSPHNFKNDYLSLKKELDTKINVTRIQVPSDVRPGEMIDKIQSIKGMEGCVIYSVKGDFVSQWKCKPKEIEDLHRLAAGGIPYHSIYTTVINSFELMEEPTFELVFGLLEEEFEAHEIWKKENTIRKTITEVTFEKKIKAELFALYDEHAFNIKNDKQTCMRFFGQKYPKSMASKIYTYLMREYGGN